MKKLLLIGLTLGAFAFAATPRAEAGISVSFGFGPGGYYRCAPAYYPYGYDYYYGPRRVVYYGPRHHRRHYRNHYRNNYRHTSYPRRHHRYWR